MQTTDHGAVLLVVGLKVWDALELDLEGASHYWFWFELDSARSRALFEEREALEEAIEALGLPPDVELLSIEARCERGDCQPCDPN